MSALTVAAGLPRALIEFAASKSARRSELLARSGIDESALADQDNRIAFDKYMRLVRAAKALTGDPALALHFGEAVDLSEFSLVGLIGRAAQTMLEAFYQLNRYGGLVVEVDLGLQNRFKLEPGDGTLWMIDTRPNPNDFPELTEQTLARIVYGCRRMIIDSGWPGGIPELRAVHVTHPAPAYRDEYDRVFGTPVVFASDKNALQVDALWPTHELAPQPRYVFGVLAEHADQLLDKLKRSKTVRDRVESLLLPILHTGAVGIDTIAEKMSVSRWTLARKLKLEGTTFEQLLDELRRTMALHYLTSKKVSVNETAYLVGFSETAAFSRAFKRWTGLNPRMLKTRAADKQ